VKLNLPSWATVTLGAIAGILAVLNETVFSAGATWGAYITIALIFLAGLGISPLVGPAFRSALHLSAAVSILISSGLAALALALTTIHMSSALHAILGAALAFASALGFAPAVTPAVLPAKGETKAAAVARSTVLPVLLLVMAAGGLLTVWAVV
jgi:hypothetical protein